MARRGGPRHADPGYNLDCRSKHCMAIMPPQRGSECVQDLLIFGKRPSQPLSQSDATHSSHTWASQGAAGQAVKTWHDMAWHGCPGSCASCTLPDFKLLTVSSHVLTSAVSLTEKTTMAHVRACSLNNGIITRRMSER